MKLKKVMLMAALAAAIGSVNMVTAFADETASGETKYGWESDAKNNWRYYDKDGNLASGWIKSEEGVYRAEIADSLGNRSAGEVTVAP